MSAASRRELVELMTASMQGRVAPLIVAIDGRSGAGKSTLAASLVSELGGVVIDGDDFYSGGTAAQWDAMTPAERANHCIDWRRQRSVLQALARGEEARWYPYDWNSDDGRLSARPLSCRPASVAILDGAYSARPELTDLLDLRVMLDVPNHLRRQRLRLREGDHYRAEWEARWASAEEHYFGEIMPPDAFDLIIR